MRLMVTVSIVGFFVAPTVRAFGLARPASSAADIKNIVRPPIRPRQPSQLYDKKNPLSASEFERREEERRRKERKDDVVLGKTSAIPGEQDFAIDPKKTEEQWMMQASDTDQQVFRLTDIGLKHLRMLQVEDADDAFTKVFELKPHVYLWQAGIVRYYLDDFTRAAEIFAKSATMSENRFGMASTEERIWRDACELKYLTQLSLEQRKALDGEGGVQAILEQARPVDTTNPNTPREDSNVYRIAQELFTASIEGNSDKVILSRAKLRAICGKHDEDLATVKPWDKMWKLLGWYYLGLHYDALGESEESKACMKAADRFCPDEISDDLIESLPKLHLTRRNWFDGGAVDESLENEEESYSSSGSSSSSDDNLLLDTIREGVSKMKVTQLQDALNARSLASTGTEEQLQQRLVAALVDDLSLEL